MNVLRPTFVERLEPRQMFSGGDPNPHLPEGDNARWKVLCDYYVGHAPAPHEVRVVAAAQS
jgi:hypothetical protein